MSSREKDSESSSGSESDGEIRNKVQSTVHRVVPSEQPRNGDDSANESPRRSRSRSRDERSRSRSRSSSYSRTRHRSRSRSRSKSPKRRRRERSNDSEEEVKETPQEKAAKEKKQQEQQMKELLTTRTGGAYIPPAKLRLMQEQITDKASAAFQRLAWEALKKSINGLINKVNSPNIAIIVRELFSENIVRGRGLLCQSIMQAQTASPTFTHVYAGT